MGGRDSSVVLPSYIPDMFYAIPMPPDRLSCGALIREVRRRHRLDQAELARRAGTAQPAISRIERNVVSPTVETLNRLLEAMGETLAILPVSLNAPPPGGGNQSIAE